MNGNEQTSEKRQWISRQSVAKPTIAQVKRAQLERGAWLRR